MKAALTTVPFNPSYLNAPFEIYLGFVGTKIDSNVSMLAPLVNRSRISREFVPS